MTSITWERTIQDRTLHDIYLLKNTSADVETITTTGTILDGYLRNSAQLRNYPHMVP